MSNRLTKQQMKTDQLQHALTDARDYVAAHRSETTRWALIAGGAVLVLGAIWGGIVLRNGRLAARFSSALALFDAPLASDSAPAPGARVFKDVAERTAAAKSELASLVKDAPSSQAGRAAAVVVLSLDGPKAATGANLDAAKAFAKSESGTVAAGVAAVAAIALARWVSRPLSDLDAAAQRLGGGALDTRSAAGNGPPEVRRLARNFNGMAGRLESLVHGSRATIADVSHQLRTPLAALRLRLDVLTQDCDEATAEELAGAQDEIARLSHLVDGLLALARAENVLVEPVTIRVDEVIRDRAAAWRPVAEERGVQLQPSCHGPVPAMAGEGHLEQVLDNLLANALDAVPAGGHVQVGAAAEGELARVVVADDGPGMTPRQQEMAFRRFVSSTPGGAGLGLAIVHRLVTSNGGSAVLSDTPGGGLTVTVTLPAQPPDRARRPDLVSD